MHALTARMHCAPSHLHREVAGTPTSMHIDTAIVHACAHAHAGQPLSPALQGPWHTS